MEVTNKKEMIEYLHKGISGDIYKRFGCFSIHFRPFEESHTSEEQEVWDFLNDDSIDNCENISIRKDDLESMMRANISTVFNGTRFYFDDYKKLESFCEIVEN